MLFFAMYELTAKNEGFKKVAIIFAKLSQKIFTLAFVIGGGYVFFNDIWYLPRYILVPFIVLMYNSFLRKKLNRPRPFVELDIESFIKHDKGGSCPSNHAASAMVISMAIFHINSVAGMIAMFVAVLTGLSRVFVGIHYPYDVLIGFVIGGTIGFLGCVIGN